MVQYQNYGHVPKEQQFRCVNAAPRFFRYEMGKKPLNNNEMCVCVYEVKDEDVLRANVKERKRDYGESELSRTLINRSIRGHAI